MGYENAKIYRIVFTDNHFYIGSTIRILKARLSSHRHRSKTDKCQLYDHANAVGWNSAIIELVELYPCSSKKALRIKENEHITLHKGNDLCLNMRNSYVDYNSQEFIVSKKHHHQDYYLKNRDKLLDDSKQNYIDNKDRKAQYNKEYLNKNRESIKEYAKSYKENNKEKVAEWSRKTYMNNRETIRAKAKEYYEANKDKILKRQRERKNKTTLESK